MKSFVISRERIPVYALYQFWDRILNSAGICVGFAWPGFGSDEATEAAVRSFHHVLEVSTMSGRANP